jgi:hypothetical protein
VSKLCLNELRRAVPEYGRIVLEHPWWDPDHLLTRKHEAEAGELTED